MDRWKKVRQNSLTEEPPASAWDVVDVDKRDEKGRTALLNVAEKGDDKMVRLLIIQRASPDVCATDGQSPLYLACRAGSLECARLLLTRQRSVANKQANNGFTPLYIAASKGYMPLVQLLLEEKADVNLNAKDGRSPLHAACESGHDACVAHILEICEAASDATVVAKAERMRRGSALFLAQQGGHEAIARLLSAESGDDDDAPAPAPDDADRVAA